MDKLVLVGVVLWALSAASSPAKQTAYSVKNTFVKDPSGEQLLLWSLANPNGATKRTTNGAGNPLPTNTASLALTNRGPLLMDHVLIDKLAAFSRERIPDRVIHAKGNGAFGHFVVTYNVSRYTKAKVFNQMGKITKTLVRFSTTAGLSGSADTTLDFRGFAIRLYTEDGNLDFPGFTFNTDLIRDPMILPDLQRALKKNPQTNIRDPNMFHDMLSIRPEMILNHVKVQADNARPGSLRAVNGSSVNVYRCINSQGEVVYCKFWWQTMQHNIPPMSDLETLALAGAEPDYYAKDLYDAIAQKHYPKWTFGFQILTQEQADALPFNPFDVTKEWRFDEIPFIPIGILVLDKNPTDFFTQIEQAAFCPGNLVPGISVSQDRVLAARIFAYKDAQRYRLGTNFQLIEVNRPLSPVDSYERNGPLRLSPEDNGNGGPVYFPNTFNGPRIDPETLEPLGLYLEGYAARIDSGDDDNFSHVRKFLELDVGYGERERIALRLAVALSEVLPAIQNRVLINCIYPIGKEFGDMVVKSLQTVEAHVTAGNSTLYLGY